MCLAVNAVNTHSPLHELRVMFSFFCFLGVGVINKYSLLRCSTCMKREHKTIEFIMKNECAEEPKHHVRFLAFTVCVCVFHISRHEYARKPAEFTSHKQKNIEKPRTMVACLVRTMLSFSTWTRTHTHTHQPLIRDWQCATYVICTIRCWWCCCNEFHSQFHYVHWEFAEHSQNVIRTREKWVRKAHVHAAVRVRSIEWITLSSSLFFAPESKSICVFVCVCFCCAFQFSLHISSASIFARINDIISISFH